jgi:hypothetical protein
MQQPSSSPNRGSARVPVRRSRSILFILFAAAALYLYLNALRLPKSPPKRLLVCYESIPHIFDGAERYLAAVVRALKSREPSMQITFVARSLSAGTCAAGEADVASLGGDVTVVEAPPDSEAFARLASLSNTAVLLPLSFFESCAGAAVNASSEDYSISLRALQRAAGCERLGTGDKRAICGTTLGIFSFDAQAARARSLEAIEPFVTQFERYKADALVFEARETALYSRADVFVMLTKQDLDDAPRTREGVPRLILGFRDDMPAALSSVASGDYVSRAAAAAQALPSWSEREGFVFLGSGNSGTNQVALWYFLRDTWPMVRALLPSATLRVIGTPPSKLCELYKVWCGWQDGLPISAKAGVRIEGRVDDVDAVLARTRVGIAPMYAGTGVNTKTGFFLARGVPVVGTPKAARGYETRVSYWSSPYGAGLTVTPHNLEFAKALVKLHQSELEWRHASKQALQLSAKLDEERAEGDDVAVLIDALF